MDTRELFKGLSDDALLEVTNEAIEEVRVRNLPLEAGSVAVEGALAPEVVVSPVTKEAVSEQLDFAYTGFASTIEGLNKDRKKKDQIPLTDQETLATELDKWLSEDKLVYVAEAQEVDPSLRFILTATPNVEVVSFDEITDLADYSWKELYSKYTPEQLSGYNPNNGAVNFSLIPIKTDEALYGTIAFQKAELAKLQKANPFLRVPSPLESITYAKTLEAQGELGGSVNFDKTYIRQFDLPTKRLDHWQYVPDFGVYDDGNSYFSYSSAGYGSYGRVAVGLERGNFR
jgi:hypothetical protein